MKINLHNYEAFFLDFKEGNLSAGQEQELFAFLKAHPELKVELDDFEELVLEPDTVFENKISLKKIDLGDEALITYAEGLADERTANEIETLAAANAAFAKELTFYKSAKLVADTEIKFPAKAKLKRGGVVIYLQSTPAYMRVAAAILLLLGMFFLVSKLTSNDVAKEKQPVLADDSKKELSVPVENKKENVVAKEENKNLAVVTNDDKKEKINAQQEKQIVENNVFIKKNDPPQLVTNTTLVNNNNPVIVSNNNNAVKDPDSIAVANTNVPAKNTATVKSWYNYEVDNEPEEKIVVTASAAPTKKTFFDKVTDAAKKVNAFGVKKVNGEDEAAKKSVSIGGLVVTETTSN